MNQSDVRIPFPSGIARLYLDFLLSFDYLLSVLIPLTVIAKASRTSGILNILEMLTLKTSYISHVVFLKSKCVSIDRSM